MRQHAYAPGSHKGLMIYTGMFQLTLLFPSAPCRLQPSSVHPPPNAGRQKVSEHQSYAC